LTISYLSCGENLVQISPSGLEIISLQGIKNMPNFCHIVQKVSNCRLINSWVTAPNLTKFLRDVDQSLPLLMHPLVLRYFNLFWNANATNEGMKVNFALFASKIGCHDNVPWAVTKRMLV